MKLNEFLDAVAPTLEGGDVPRPFEAGDVVYCEGASAIEGDVIAVEESGLEDGSQSVYIIWRVTETCESSEDLVLVKKGARA